MSKKLLLTGASGFLGWNVIKANPGWDIVGLVRNNPVVGIATKQADLADTEQLKAVLAAIAPDAIMHLAAQSDVNKCQQEPELAAETNVAPIEILATYARQHAIPLVYTSTDMVFDGENAPYAEESAAEPVNLYGSQKLEAEQQLLKFYPNGCVCRMPLMVGEGGAGVPRFLRAFENHDPEKGPLQFFEDEYRTVAGGYSAAKGLWLAIEKQWSGVWHLGGRDRISRFELGEMINRIFKYDYTLAGGSQKDVKMLAPRPADLTLDSNKAFAFGYDPLPVAKELELIKAGCLYS